MLVPIDGDGQNDPADIPQLLERLDLGFDVVSGWRRNRKDPWLTRKVPSWVANRLVARLSGVALHDFGCTLKAYRRQVLEGVRLYGEMHRFIPIFATWQGARVTELVVNHRPRTAGRTKYGLGRTLNVVLDLLLIRFFFRYSQRPMHLFGRIGIYSMLLSALSFAAMLYYKFRPLLTGAPKKDFVETPLPLLVVQFFLTGVISILLGVRRRHGDANVLRIAVEDDLPARHNPPDPGTDPPSRVTVRFQNLGQPLGGERICHR